MSIPVKSAGTGNIYLGDKIVAESGCGPEYYEIDFRNNTLNGIKEDGWIPNNGDSYVVLNSNGYQMSGNHGDGIYKMFDFSNAKKIIFDSIMYRQQGGWIGLDIAGLGDTINMFLAGYYSSGSYTNYSGYGINISPEGYADTSSAYRGSYPNGDYTIKLEADLESKVVTLTGTPQTITRSITDSNVASVRSSGKLWVEPGSPQYVRRLSITIYNN